jgi:hypothetical protein
VILPNETTEHPINKSKKAIRIKAFRKIGISSIGKIDFFTFTKIFNGFD